ncbi:MAG: hypothetical protein ABW075_10335 [Aeromicrobium sp.]
MTRAVAWSLAVLTMLLVVADTVVIARSTSWWSTDTIGLHGWPLIDLASVGSAILGALIVAAHGRHPTGWLLLLIGVATAISLVTEAYSIWVLDEGGPGSTIAAQRAGWVAVMFGGPLSISALGIIFLTIPTGTLLSRRWRPVAGALVLGYALSLIGLMMTSPADVVDRAGASDGVSVGDVVGGIGILTTSFALVASVVSMVVRLRRSEGVARQQLRWVVSAAVFVVITLVAVLIGQALVSDGRQSALTSIPLFLSYLVLVVSIGVSMLRFRLYDLDVIISRAVALGCATAFVTATYIALVVVVGDRAGDTVESFWVSWGVMVVVSLAFQPLRRWVVRLADRLAYGPRAQPYEALADFSRRAGISPSPDELLPAVAEASGLASSALESQALIELPDGSTRSAPWVDRTAASRRQVRGEWTEIPVADPGGEVGTIRLLLPASRGLRPHERRLLQDIAEQAGVAFRNIGLEAALAAHVRQLDEQTVELAASRARLIEASDAERLRLEAAIAREVLTRLRDLRAELAGASPDAVSTEQIDGYVADATLTLETLRDLTKGIHPTLLTRGGLASALESYMARSATGTALVVEPAVASTRWPDRVEAAAYFCCTQMVTFGPPRAVTLRRAADGRGLEVCFTGTAPDGPVLQSMIDRVEALGGHLEQEGDELLVRLPRVPELSAVGSG